MKRRNKWIVFVCLVFGLAPIILWGYSFFRTIYDLKWMEARRSVLLYETNHQALLDASRELLRQVAIGQIKPGTYGIHVNQAPETKQFPQLILDLDPVSVDIDEYGVDMKMSVAVRYGVYATSENFKYSDSEIFKIDDRTWAIELIKGLFYYDEDFIKHPEHMKEVEELLKKSKSEKQKNSVTVEKISKNHALLKKFKPNIY